jgi:hypothetical protein
MRLKMILAPAAGLALVGGTAALHLPQDASAQVAAPRPPSPKPFQSSRITVAAPT